MKLKFDFKVLFFTILIISCEFLLLGMHEKNITLTTKQIENEKLRDSIRILQFKLNQNNIITENIYVEYENYKSKYFNFNIEYLNQQIDTNGIKK